MELLSLPRETILDILNHLSIFDLIFRVKFTCKYLYDLCFVPSLFRHVDLTYKHVLENEAFSNQSNAIKHLQIVGEHLRSLTAGFSDLGEHVSSDDCSRYEDVLLSKIFSFIPDLKALTIHGLNNMKHSTFEALILKYPNLEELTFSVMPTSHEGIPQLLSLSQSPVNNMKRLSITILDDYGDENWKCDDKITEAFIQVIKKNKLLQTIDVAFDYFTSDDIIPILFSADYVKLKELHLSCPLYFPRELPFVVGSTTLISLSLDNTRVSDVVMERVSRGCPNLRDISVRGCCLLTDIGISHIGKHCSHLQRYVKITMIILV